MQSRAIVVGLQICPGYREPMTPVESARAVENLGLEGDRPRQRRQQAPGAVDRGRDTGETRLARGRREGEYHHARHYVDGLVHRHTVVRGPGGPGNHGECHPCSRMEELRPGLLQELGGQRGMFGARGAERHD